ncbi:MAG: hypothetical protein E5V74_02675, partial [Mesorhizobium sp.]
MLDRLAFIAFVQKWATWPWRFSQRRLSSVGASGQARARLASLAQPERPMSKALPTRIGILLTAGIAIFFWVLLDPSWAQQSPAGLSPEKARQFLNLLSDP